MSDAIKEQGTQRIEKWDNIRGILMILVVFAHVIEPEVNGQGNFKGLFWLIYLFHMPAFFFVSGLFSKSAVKNRRYDRVVGYVFLFFAIKMLVFLSKTIVSQKPPLFHVYWEDGIAWYAFCMAVFLLVTILAQDLKPGHILAGAILLACFAGYDDSIGDTLVLSRSICFFPFFYAGFCASKDTVMEKVSPNLFRIISGVVFYILLITAVFAADRVYWLRPLVTGRNPFSKLNRFASFGGLIRLVYYPAVMAVCLTLFSLAPAKKTFLGHLGRRSLSVFVLHIPLLNLLNLFGFKDRFVEWNIFSSHLIPYIILTAGVLLLCSAAWPYRICRYILDIKKD